MIDNYRRYRAGFAIFIAAILGANPGLATPSPEHLCFDAARHAASQTGVPLSVLMAITMTETGRSRGGTTQPWPWTVNMEGAGHWFDVRNEARQFVDQHFERGARSFDVGCFQINYRWHGENFSSIEEMFDPRANAIYAAEFLARLYSEKGNWSAAAGAYHSRTESFATQYRARFDALRAEVTGQVPEIMAAAPLPAQDALPEIERVNWFPLLISGGRPATAGSLVPLDRSR